MGTPFQNAVFLVVSMITTGILIEMLLTLIANELRNEDES